MNNFDWKQFGQFLAGAASGLFVGWFCFAATFFLLRWLETLIIASYHRLLFFFVGAIGLLLLCRVFGFAAGVTCAYFWRHVANREQIEQWRLWVLIALFLPLLGLGLLIAIAAICVAALLVVKPFNRGVETGIVWWREQRWRYFIGLANHYERDANDYQRDADER